MVVGSETHGIGCFVSTTGLRVSQRFVWRGGGQRGFGVLWQPAFLVGGEASVSFALLGARRAILRAVVVDIVRPIVTGCLCYILRFFLNTVTCNLERPAR